MRVVVVPNKLRDAIQDKMRAKLNGRRITDADFEHLYTELLNYYDTHGVIPEFDITLKDGGDE